MPQKLFALLMLFMLTGCTTQDTLQRTLTENQEAREFLERNPEAIVTHTLLDQQTVTGFLAQIRAECNTEFTPNAAWESTFVTADERLVLYASPDGKKVLCSTHSGEREEAECETDADCRDDTALTTDACVGTPKKCVHSLKLCREMQGMVCETGAECSQKTVKTADAEFRCRAKCAPTNPCSGIVCSEGEICSAGHCQPANQGPCANVRCPANKKCVNGVCEEKTCDEQHGYVCAGSYSHCPEQTYASSETVPCCTVECTLPPVG